MATWDVNVTASIDDGSIANAKLGDMPEATVKGRGVGNGTGAPHDLDADNVSDILDGATDPFLRTSALPPIPTHRLNTNVVYVSKVGNDLDSGLTVAEPKLTINAALTAANALSPNPAAVYVVDAGEYTEDLKLGSVPVIAPSATLIGRVDMSTNAMLVIKNHYPAIDASVCVDADNATGYAYYICADKLDARGKLGTFTSCDAIRNQYNGMVLHVKCPVIIGSQTAVHATNNTTGHIHLDVNDIYCTGSGNVGLYAEDTVGVGGRIYGKVDHIINLSGATSSIGVYTASANSFISITSNEINTDTAYNCTVGSLYLICPRILGTRTGTPVFEASTHIVTGTQPLDSDLTQIAALTPANDDILQRKAGAWTNRTIAQLLTDLNLASLYQPLDADLSAIAALSTNGLVERTGAGTAAIRTIGASAGTDILSRDDGDARYLTPFAYSLLPTWTVGTQATTSTSLTDVTDTELTVPSAGLYEVEYRVTYDANATTTGAGFSLRNTVAGTIVYNAVTAFLDAGTADRGVIVGGTSTSVAVASSRATTANTAIVRANIIFSAASAIRLQFRTEIATSTTITVTNVIGFIRRVA